MLLPFLPPATLQGDWLWIRNPMSLACPRWLIRMSTQHPPTPTPLQPNTSLCLLLSRSCTSLITAPVCLILTNSFLLLCTCSPFSLSSFLHRPAFVLPSPPAASLFPFISPPPCQEAYSWLPHCTPIYSQVCAAFTCCFLL